MSRRKRSSVPVGAMLTALAIIAVAAFLALFLGDGVTTLTPQGNPPAESAPENQ